MNKSKYKSRLKDIVLNATRSILSPLLSFLLSYIIIHNYSKELWGEFVSYLLFFFVANMILSWGGKDYLLRQFSEEPSKIINKWQTYFIARLPLFIIVILSIPLIYSWKEFQFLAIWISASYISQSVVPIFLYQRDYFKIIVVELFSFFVLVGYTLNSSHINLTDFGLFYGYYCLVKTVLLVILYQSFFRFKNFVFKPALLWVSLPFLLMALVGFFQGKIDLYVFAAFHSKALLADYQVISGFLIFSQSIATILVLPYIKNVYRMKTSGIAKLSQLVGISGLVINAVVLGSIIVVLRFFFEIIFNSEQVIIAYLIGFPSYFYAIRVYYLFSNGKENKVLIVSLWSLLVNLTLSVILLYFGWKITGVLLANGVAQLVCLILYLQYKIDDKTA
ncbi:MAG: lipopolysaccharide biosynthesis protein [Crocinitomicaceae bacterium]